MLNNYEMRQAVMMYMDDHDMSKPRNKMTLATIIATDVPKDNRFTLKEKREFFIALSNAMEILNIAYRTTKEDFNNIGLFIIANALDINE